VDHVRLIVDEGADVDHGWLLELAERVATELGISVSERTDLDAAAVIAVFEVDATPETIAAISALAVPCVWIDLADAGRPLIARVPESAPLIRGRGVEGVRWGLAHATRLAEAPPARVPYGVGRERFYDLRLPQGGSSPSPVAVLLHGGFWRERWTLDTIEPLALDLGARGFATCNLEYRRVGLSGGGWPRTEEDIADALRQIAGDDTGRLDPDRIVLIGHSAGGQLAVAAASRVAPNGIHPRLVVSLAGVLDLRLCAQRGLGDTGNAALAYGEATPGDLDACYRASSPSELPPLAAAQLIVQGLDDSPDLAEMGRRYVARLREAGAEVDVVELPGNHFDVITPASGIWRETAAAVERAVSS
jgi:acetyl esterase/lipase